MPQSLKITIPSPCIQRWDDMMPSGEGRYCKHCSKTVIDFTSFTDAELYSYFLKNRQVCGMFLASQLNRDIVPVQPQSKLYRLFVAMGLTLMFTQVPAVQAKIALFNTVLAGDWQSDDDTGAVANLTGIVTDTLGQPISNVIVQVLRNGNLQSVLTDSTGFFGINLQPGRYTLVLRHSSYITVQDSTIIIGQAEKQEVKYIMTGKSYDISPEIKLDKRQMLIMGGPWSPEIPPIEKYVNKKKIKRKK